MHRSRKQQATRAPVPHTCHSRALLLPFWWQEGSRGSLALQLTQPGEQALERTSSNQPCCVGLCAGVPLYSRAVGSIHCPAPWQSHRNPGSTLPPRAHFILAHFFLGDPCHYWTGWAFLFWKTLTNMIHLLCVQKVATSSPWSNMLNSTDVSSANTTESGKFTKARSQLAYI